MHDRAAVVGTPVGVAEVRALLELPLLAVDDVLPIYGDKIVSVGAHVGVVHADAVEDLEGIHVPTLCIRRNEKKNKTSPKPCPHCFLPLCKQFGSPDLTHRLSRI